MGALGLFDIVWRVMVAGILAAMPGSVAWGLLLGVLAAVRRFGNRRGLAREARGAVLP